MPKVPEQRKDEDDKGGGGRIHQTENRDKSNKRGGRPHAGGAGTNKKPKKK
jgi:hypothetical protein